MELVTLDPHPRKSIPASPLREVFYYVTFACNLRCRHCYVGDNLAPGTHADAEQVIRTLEDCRDAGARQVVFLGGEPTLHPDYQRILAEAGRIGFSRLVSDTNGLGNDPLPPEGELRRRFAVRLSFEDDRPAGHDAIRGRGTFERSLACLQRVVAEHVRVEVTCTLNAANVARAGSIAAFFAGEGASEVNFHFLSRMGNARGAAGLGLTPAAVLGAQEQLEAVRRAGRAPVRFPRLLVREEGLDGEIAQGCGCGILDRSRLLIFPHGQYRRCPLEIDAALEHRPDPDLAGATYRGCPLQDRLFPLGMDRGLVMTCISWKGHAAHPQAGLSSAACR